MLSVANYVIMIEITDCDIVFLQYTSAACFSIYAADKELWHFPLVSTFIQHLMTELFYQS